MKEGDEINKRVSQAINETDDDLCRALWLGVMVQAMIDVSSKSQESRSRIDRGLALEWVAARDGIQGDFTTVCHLAGVNESNMRQRFTKILRGDAESIDFRCMKKALSKNRAHEDRKRYFRRAKRNECLRRAEQKNRPPTQPTNDESFVKETG